MKWQIKRWLHYFFGKEPFKIQIGGYVKITVDFTSSTLKEIKTMFKDQIDMSCSLCKYELLGEVTIIVRTPMPEDPLAQIGTVAWKTDVLVHTKSSWKIYIKKLIEKEIKFSGDRL